MQFELFFHYLFYFCFALKIHVIIQNFKIVLLIINILILAFIFFIFYFSWFFWKNFICLQIHSSILIYFFSIYFLFFRLFFFYLFIKLIFIFKFTLESKTYSCHLIYFFISILTSIFCCYFWFWIFLYNWIFIFLISSFNI